MATVTIAELTLGRLTNATARVDHDDMATRHGEAQAPVSITLEGELDTVTLELDRMDGGGEPARDAATLLRALADDLDREAETYTDHPVRHDGFVGIDRDGWGAALDDQPVDVPRGASEAGAIAALELACRAAGYFPALWIDRHGRGTEDPLGPDEVTGALTEVLEVGALGEPSCEHCGDPIERHGGQWRHRANWWDVAGLLIAPREPDEPAHVECVPDDPDDGRVATPDTVLDRDELAAALADLVGQ